MKIMACVGLTIVASALLLTAAAGPLHAQTDCLACHGDPSMQDASGKTIGVSADKFHASIHGSLQCQDCHTNVKGYPHPANAATVDCSRCHTEPAAGVSGSVHAKASEHPCISCHGDPHSIVARSDPKSPVYPLNIPKTCGSCHGNEAMAKNFGL